MTGDEQISKFPERTFWSRLARKIQGKSHANENSESKQLSVSLVGAGNIVRGKYLPLLRSKKNYRLVSVYDINEEAARKISEVLGGRVAHSVEELLADPIDAVLICTPPSYHAPIAIQALKANKNILCEKPMGASLAEADSMIEVAKEHSVVTMVNFSFRFSNEWAFVRSIIHSGVLGQLYSVWGTVSQGGWYSADHAPSNERVDAAAWRFSPRSGGIVYEMGAHAADLCSWIFGEPETVFAYTHAFHHSTNASEDLCQVMFNWKSGLSAQLQICRTATGYREHTFIEIHGSNGSLKLDNGQIYLWTRQVPRWRSLLVPQREGGDILDVFYRAVVKSDDASLPTFEDGWKNNNLLDAILRSAATEQVVRLRDHTLDMASRG